MKKIKSLMAVVLTVVLLFATSSILFNNVYATVIDQDTGVEYVGSSTEVYSYLVGKTKTKFEFNTAEFMIIYANNSVGGNLYRQNRETVPNEALIPVYNYDNGQSNDGWHDSKIDARDSSNLRSLARLEDSAEYDEMTLEQHRADWQKIANDIIKSLSNKLEISDSDVVLTVKVTTPILEGVTTAVDNYEINSTTGVTQSIIEKTAALRTANLNYTIAAMGEHYNATHSTTVEQQIITVSAKTVDGAEYGLVLGTDNNFYLLQTKEADQEPDEPVVKEFKTDLTYRAEASGKKVDGKMDKDVFLPPYYENEDKNAKKDADAVGIITSKTDEEIVATNDVALTDKNVKGNPNSEGWYYPDLTNKKVIEKVYPFDEFNNPKDNGAVKETVKLTGKDGGIDNQTPNIRWTLRRINYDKKTNADKSITITITYNLPIDKNSIPEGWEPLVDEDGGIRRIRRTFKEGEDYTKDVTVEQNGESKATVTTPVEVKWNKADKVIPQTGAFTMALVAIVAGIAVFAYTRFRKLN